MRYSRDVVVFDDNEAAVENEVGRFARLKGKVCYQFATRRCAF